MTRTPLSRSKGQGHQAALLTAVLTRRAAAAVSVGTYWPWKTTATLRSARRREALRRPQREERGGGISWRPAAYSLFYLPTKLNTSSSFSFKFTVFSVTGTDFTHNAIPIGYSHDSHAYLYTLRSDFSENNEGRGLSAYAQSVGQLLYV